MKHWLLRIVCIGFLLGVGLSQTSVGTEQSLIYAKGQWTRLLDGSGWSVGGTSQDKDLVYLWRYARRPPPEPRISFLDTARYLIYFSPIEVQALHLPTTTLTEAQVRYRAAGDYQEQFQFVLIEPGAGIRIYRRHGALSPDGQRIVYLHGRSRAFEILEDFSRQEGLYWRVPPILRITPGPEMGDSLRAFEAYLALLANEGLTSQEEFGPWPHWLSGVVGWLSNTEFLYLANRTTDVKSAWLNRDEKWLEKIRWSLWRLNAKDRAEQLIWDSQTLGEQVLEVRKIPQLRLLVETVAHLAVIDREGRTRLHLSNADWEFPAVWLDAQQDLWGGGPSVAVSPDGSALLLQSRGTQELWAVKTDGGQSMKLPAVPAPVRQENRVYVSFAPDASRLAYFTMVEGEPALVVMELRDPPSIRLYRIEDPEEVLRTTLSWVDKDTLLLSAIKRTARQDMRQAEADQKVWSTWLLRLAEEGKP